RPRLDQPPGQQAALADLRFAVAGARRLRLALQLEGAADRGRCQHGERPLVLPRQRLGRPRRLGRAQRRLQAGAQGAAAGEARGPSSFATKAPTLGSSVIWVIDVTFRPDSAHAWLRKWSLLPWAKLRTTARRCACLARPGITSLKRTPGTVVSMADRVPRICS